MSQRYARFSLQFDKKCSDAFCPDCYLRPNLVRRSCAPPDSLSVNALKQKTKNSSAKHRTGYRLFLSIWFASVVGLLPTGGIAQGTQTVSPAQVPSAQQVLDQEVSGDTPAPQGATENASPDEIVTETGSADPWELFFPPPDSRFDWIQLTSGEWLKGELKGLYNHQLEFESDELDTLQFDWEDIKSIRSAFPKEVGYEDTADEAMRLLPFRGERAPTVAYGQLTLIGHKMTIATSPAAITINRDQIVTIARGTGEEGGLWSGELSIGANFRGGNSDLSDANVYMKVLRRRAISRFYSDYRASFSRAGEEELSNSHRIKSWFDVFQSSRKYWRMVYAEYFRDRFINIENQLTLGSGLGYDIIRTAKTEWDVLLGIGALYKESASVEANEDPSNTSPALTLGSRLDIELTSRLDYFLSYTAQIVDEENGSYVHEVVTTLSSDITGNLDLDLTLVWNHTQEPRRAEDGTLPEQDDYRFSVSVSYEF